VTRLQPYIKFRFLVEFERNLVPSVSWVMLKDSNSVHNSYTVSEEDIVLWVMLPLTVNHHLPCCSVGISHSNAPSTQLCN